MVWCDWSIFRPDLPTHPSSLPPSLCIQWGNLYFNINLQSITVHSSWLFGRAVRACKFRQVDMFSESVQVTPERHREEMFYQCSHGHNGTAEREHRKWKNRQDITWISEEHTCCHHKDICENHTSNFTLLWTHTKYCIVEFTNSLIWTYL